MNTETINSFVDILATSMLIPVLIFIVLYVRRSPWWVTDLGVAALSSKLAQLLVFIVVAASLAWHQYPGREWVRLCGYLPVVVMAWLDVVNLARYQRAFPEGKKRAGKRPRALELLRRYFRPPLD